MRKKRNFKWQKGWEKIDETESGYTETGYDFFDYVWPIPLMKYKGGDIWYIGEIENGQYPNRSCLFYNEQSARQEFESVKAFRINELEMSFCKLERMSTEELSEWLYKFGKNPYIGKNMYYNDALCFLPETQPQSDEDMEL